MITFNSKPLPSFAKVTGYSISVAGDLAIRETEIPRRIGNVDNGIKVGAKTHSFSLLVLPEQGKSIHQQADELKEWLMGDSWETGKLVFNDQPDKYIIGRFANSIELKDLFIMGETEIQFIASDPIKYSSDLSSKGSSAGTTSVDYKGIEKAPTVITVQVLTNCEDIIITHKQTNKKALVLGSFKAGQTIVIDSDKKVVKLNGVVQMRLISLDNDWLYLQRGMNTFTFTSRNSVVNNFGVQYRTAY